MSDDGPGIPEDTLAACGKRMAAAGPERPERRGGLGIFNVHRRILLYFGAGRRARRRTVHGKQARSGHDGSFVIEIPQLKEAHHDDGQERFSSWMTSREARLGIQSDAGPTGPPAGTGC